VKPKNRVRFVVEPYALRLRNKVTQNGWQIVATDSVTGKRRKFFNGGKEICEKLGWVWGTKNRLSNSNHIVYKKIYAEALQKAEEYNKIIFIETLTQE
jgi:hypothetical protein